MPLSPSLIREKCQFGVNEYFLAEKCAKVGNSCSFGADVDKISIFVGQAPIEYMRFNLILDTKLSETILYPLNTNV